MSILSTKSLLRLGYTMVLLSTIFITPTHAIEYGGFGGRPAFPRADNARTESIFIHTLEPGAVQKE